MTEAEWLACADPTRMMIFLRQRASPRKFRLLSSAFCRRNEWFMLLPDGGGIIKAVEAWADGIGSGSRIESSVENLNLSNSPAEYARSRPAMRLGFCSEDAYVAATYTLAWASGDDPAEEQECVTLLRDIFGNPFRPVAVDPSWLTSTVVALAHGVYADRAFDRLPILSDALEDAGCEHADLLAHCRGPGPHARGCWVVDLLLGKH